jgi:hypothetical protein
MPSLFRLSQRDSRRLHVLRSREPQRGAARAPRSQLPRIPSVVGVAHRPWLDALIAAVPGSDVKQLEPRVGDTLRAAVLRELRRRRSAFQPVPDQKREVPVFMNALAYYQRTFGHACSAVLQAVKRASETLQRISWPAPRTRCMSSTSRSSNPSRPIDLCSRISGTWSQAV